MARRSPDEEPRKIWGWRIGANCPSCGRMLAHVAAGRPDGQSVRAIAQCTDCRRQFGLVVTLADVTRELRGRPAHPESCGCTPCTRDRARRRRDAASLPVAKPEPGQESEVA